MNQPQDPAVEQMRAEKNSLTTQIATKQLDIRALTKSINLLHHSINDLTDNFMTQVSEIVNIINFDS